MTSMVPAPASLARSLAGAQARRWKLVCAGVAGLAVSDLVAALRLRRVSAPAPTCGLAVEFLLAAAVQVNVQLEQFAVAGDWQSVSTESSRYTQAESLAQTLVDRPGHGALGHFLVMPAAYVVAHDLSVDRACHAGLALDADHLDLLLPVLRAVVRDVACEIFATANLAVASFEVFQAAERLREERARAGETTASHRDTVPGRQTHDVVDEVLTWADRHAGTEGAAGPRAADFPGAAVLEQERSAGLAAELARGILAGIRAQGAGRGREPRASAEQVARACAALETTRVLLVERGMLPACGERAVPEAPARRPSDDGPAQARLAAAALAYGAV